MKKLISFIFKLTILAIVLLFVLNNADAIKEVISQFVGGVHMQTVTPPHVTTGTTPPWESINTKVPDPVVDTISKGQFEMAMNKTNFMVVTENHYTDGGYNSTFSYVTENAKGGRDGDSFSSFQIDYAKVDGVWYYLNYENGSVFGTKLPDEVEVDVTVRSVAYANDLTFEDLTYNASKGCYTFSTIFHTDNGEVSIPINLYFNNGNLEFVEIFWIGWGDNSYRSVSYISNYNSELNIPEFTTVENN